MEILTVLDELYHVNPEDEESVMEQLKHSIPYLFFKDGRKSVCLIVNNIVSIEYYKKVK